MGDRLFLERPVGLAIDRQFRGTVVVGARLGRLPLAGEILAAGVDLNLGQREDLAVARQFDSHIPTGGAGVFRLGVGDGGRQARENEIAIRGPARPLGRQRGVGNGFQPQSCDPGERHLRRHGVGVVPRSGASHPQRAIRLKAESRLSGRLRGNVRQHRPLGSLAQGFLPGPLFLGERRGGVVEPLLERRNLGLDFLESTFHIGGWGGQGGKFIPLVAVGRLVEDAVELVVLGLADRIELVAVALGTADGQPHPDLQRGVGPVLHGRHAVLFVVGAPFGVGQGVAVEGRGDFLVNGRPGTQIASQLVNGELIERLVGIEGVNHPVAVSPDRAEGVASQPLRVGIPGQIEPDPTPAFAIGRVGQEAIDQPFVGVGSGVLHKRGHLGGGRGNAAQVETQSADQGVLVGDGVGLQTQRSEPGRDPGINAVPRPGDVLPARRGMTPRRDERPMLGIRGPLFDPAADQLHLGRCQFARPAGRHFQLGIGRCDPFPQFALGDFARHNRPAAGVERGGGIGPAIQPQARLALSLIGTMAVVAGPREDGTNVAEIIDGGGLRRGQGGDGRQPQRNAGKSGAHGRKTSKDRRNNQTLGYQPPAGDGEGRTGRCWGPATKRGSDQSPVRRGQAGAQRCTRRCPSKWAVKRSTPLGWRSKSNISLGVFSRWKSSTDSGSQNPSSLATIPSTGPRG